MESLGDLTDVKPLSQMKELKVYTLHDILDDEANFKTKPFSRFFYLCSHASPLYCEVWKVLETNCIR